MAKILEPGTSVYDNKGNLLKVTPSASKMPVASPYSPAAPIQPTNPVTSISSDRGASILESEKKKLDAETAKMTATNNATYQEQSKTNAKSSQLKPKGYTYDDAKKAGIDLNNASYDVESGTFLPDEGDAASEEDAQYKSDLSAIEKAFKTQENYMDDAQRAVLSSLKGIYADLATETKEANKRSLKSFENFGIREGGQRYSGEIQQGILNAEERAGLGRLEKIAIEQANATATARQAYADKKYSFFMDKRNEITKLTEKRQEEIDKLRESAMKRKEAAEAAKIQATRDTAVSGLLEQGITDPKKMLTLLNYDDAGNQIGDFSAEELKKTLTSLSGGNYEKLSGDLRDYFILKENGSLPANISSLPEGQQLNAWMNYVKPQKVPGGKAINKITLSEAKSQKLPLSVVGMSEDEVIDSLQSEEPPIWFWEKANSESNKTYTRNAVRPLWDEYRTAFQSTFEGEDADVYETKDYTNQAKTYFKGAYGDAVDQETLDLLAKYVQLEIDGGLSYKAAIEKVIEDSQ